MQISKCNKKRNIVSKINDKYNLILENNQICLVGVKIMVHVYIQCN